MHGTIDDAIDGGPVQIQAGYAWMIASAAALGGLLFGYDFVVIGGARPFYERYFELNSEAMIGWATSCALIGCLAGSLLSGALGDRFGRKALLNVSAALFGVTSVCTGWAPDFETFVLGRILGGVAIGMSSNVSPTYIAEISPAAMRGRLVTLNQVAIVIGIVAAQLVNWLIAEPVPDGATDTLIQASWNGQFGWRWMFSAVAVPSLLFFFCSFLIPESPRWLEIKGRLEDARKVLDRIGGARLDANRFGDAEQVSVSASSAGAPWAALLSPAMRPILTIAIALKVLQQWSGINVLLNYAAEVYRGAGYGIDDVMFNIVITGAINLLFTLIALATVDRFGRRILMLIGCAALTVSHFSLGLSYAAGLTGSPILLLTLSSIGIYALSLGPVTWVLVAEIFPTSVRAVGMSLATSALWIACFVLTFTFPFLQRYAGVDGTFGIYAGICFAGLLFVWRRIPETKGHDLEEIGVAIETGRDRVGNASDFAVADQIGVGANLTTPHRTDPSRGVEAHSQPSIGV